MMTKAQIVNFLLQGLDIKYLREHQGFTAKDYSQLCLDVQRIEKDLEAMDILKSSIKSGKQILNVDIYDDPKIKEWLENDK